MVYFTENIWCLIHNYTKSLSETISKYKFRQISFFKLTRILLATFILLYCTHCKHFLINIFTSSPLELEFTNIKCLPLSSLRSSYCGVCCTRQTFYVCFYWIFSIAYIDTSSASDT